MSMFDWFGGGLGSLGGGLGGWIPDPFTDERYQDVITRIRNRESREMLDKAHEFYKKAGSPKPTVEIHTPYIIPGQCVHRDDVKLLEDK